MYECAKNSSTIFSMLADYTRVAKANYVGISNKGEIKCGVTHGLLCEYLYFLDHFCILIAKMNTPRGKQV